MLTGKSAIVTGASSGIGRSIAREFAKQGAVVYAVARREDKLQSLSAECDGLRGIVLPVLLDITNYQGVKNLLMRVNKEQGKLDILVNNAGIMKDALLGMITEDMLMELFQTNVFALIQSSQMAVRFMTRKKSGTIINISSMVGISGNEGQSAYAAAKGAVISFTKAAAKELAPFGVRMNAIAPGVIDTKLLSSVSQEQRKKKIEGIRMGRIGTPEDITGTALYLASDLSGYVTGQIIGVDGAATY